jgi:hypothetical protein
LQYMPYVCNLKFDELSTVVCGSSKCDWQGDSSEWHSGLTGYYPIERDTCWGNHPGEF